MTWALLAYRAEQQLQRPYKAGPCKMAKHPEEMDEMGLA
jgi:hypothetical protein